MLKYLQILILGPSDCEHTNDVRRLNGKLNSVQACIMGKSKMKSFHSVFNHQCVQVRLFILIIVESFLQVLMVVNIFVCSYFSTAGTLMSLEKENVHTSNVVGQCKKLYDARACFLNGVETLHTQNN